MLSGMQEPRPAQDFPVLFADESTEHLRRWEYINDIQENNNIFPQIFATNQPTEKDFTPLINKLSTELANEFYIQLIKKCDGKKVIAEEQTYKAPGAGTAITCIFILATITALNTIEQTNRKEVPNIVNYFSQEKNQHDFLDIMCKAIPENVKSTITLNQGQSLANKIKPKFEPALKDLGTQKQVQSFSFDKSQENLTTQNTEQAQKFNEFTEKLEQKLATQDNNFIELKNELKTTAAAIEKKHSRFKRLCCVGSTIALSATSLALLYAAWLSGANTRTVDYNFTTYIDNQKAAAQFIIDNLGPLIKK